MTLRTYISALLTFAEENPEALNLEVVTSKDDEGNGYNPVYYGPQAGKYEDGEFDAEQEDKNAVCVN